MRITKGYKQTEVGSIPEEWQVYSIRQVAETSSGGTPSRANPEYYKGDIKWLTTGELKDCKIFDSIEHISAEAINNSSAKLFPKGTLLMAMYGATIGKLGILETEASTNQACCAIKCRSCDTSYLFYLLLHYRRAIIDHGCGAGQPNISQGIVKELTFAFPSLTEQKAIAKQLSEIDELIAGLGEQIEKKRQIKEGAMQQLLTGKTRLPGFSQPWREVELGELLAYEQPTQYLVSSTDYVEQGTPVLTAGKTFILGYTIEDWGIYNNLPVIIFDDFVTESKYVDFPFKAKSSAMKMLSLKDKSNNLRFIYEKMQQIDFPMTDHKRYWIAEYSKILVSIPNFEEQNAIAQILSDMDDEISALEAERDKYILIKQGMMQELLTGKTRLV